MITKQEKERLKNEMFTPGETLGDEMDISALSPELRAKIEELKRLTYIGDDPRGWGEHPDRGPLEAEIKAELDTWPDEKLAAFGESVKGDALWFLFGALCDLSDTRTVLKPKFN